MIGPSRPQRRRAKRARLRATRAAPISFGVADERPRSMGVTALSMTCRLSLFESPDDAHELLDHLGLVSKVRVGGHTRTLSNRRSALDDRLCDLLVRDGALPRCIAERARLWGQSRRAWAVADPSAAMTHDAFSAERSLRCRRSEHRGVGLWNRRRRRLLGLNARRLLCRRFFSARAQGRS